jgi:hypothetical protein
MMNTRGQPKLVEQINELFDQNSRNIVRELKRRALMETCDYIEKHMVLVNPNFGDRYELLDYAIQNISVTNGLWLEFGVYKGNTIKHIAGKTKSPVYGFDSFNGNPEDWRSEYKKGAFALKKLPRFPQNIKIEKGYFEDSIPQFIKRNSKPIAFMHIDCDLYSSTKTILDLLGEQLICGSILVFDEFFNYPGWKQHEFKAFMEFVENGKRTFEYLGYVYKHSQVAIRIMS